MRTKTIKAVLRKLHDELCASITDESVRKLVKENSIISGGCIVSMLRGEEVNDYDYYFTNKETTKAVADYYVKTFNASKTNNDRSASVVVEEDRVKIWIGSNGVTGVSPEEPDDGFIEEDKPKFRPVFLTDNAITLSNKVQMVIRFYGEPDVIHDNYDFVHAMSYWRSSNGHLDTPVNTLLAIMNKELIYTGSKYPLASLVRLRKFIKRDWNVNAGQILKIALNLQEFNLTDPKVLSDQLVGMDAAYFRAVLHTIEDKIAEDASFSVTNSYLVEIIDRIF